MPFAQDRRKYVLLAPELYAYGVVPLWHIAITGSSGTFTVTHRGNTSAPIAYNATTGAVQSALELVPSIGTGNVTVTGSAGAYDVWLHDAGEPSYRHALPVTALGAAGATATVTGGPTWVFGKVTKFGHDEKLNVIVEPEERNSPDPLYQDSATQGTAITDWLFEGGLRMNQLGHYAAMMGLNDVTTLVGGTTTAYDHEFKPGAGDGLSYTVMAWDGKALWISVGVVGTSLKLTSKAGEKAECQFSLKGWGYLAEMISDVSITPTRPPSQGAGSFPRLAPTRRGTLAKIAGSQVRYLQDWVFDYTRAAKPLSSQTGTRNPYRPEYGDRQGNFDGTLIFDDVTEAQQALATTLGIRAFEFTLPGVEVVNTSPATTDRLLVELFNVLYQDLTDDLGRPAPMLKIKGPTLYNDSEGAQFALTVRDNRSTDYVT